jgi:hypothetical protein
VVDIFLGYDFKEWSEIIRNLVLCAVAIFTAWVALQGLSQWKKQEDWKENRKLAKNFLKEIYKIREAIRDCRSPIMLSGEMYAASEGKGLDFRKNDELRQAKQNAYVKRFNNVSDCLEEIYPLELEAKVVWENELPEFVDCLRRLISELRVAIEDNPLFEFGGQLTGEELKANRKIIYGRFNEGDDYGNRVDKLVDDTTKILEPYLGRRP